VFYRIGYLTAAVQQRERIIVAMEIGQRVVYGGWGMVAIATAIVVVSGAALTSSVLLTGFLVGAALGLISPRQ
jgi:hypothetical protein